MLKTATMTPIEPPTASGMICTSAVAMAEIISVPDKIPVKIPAAKMMDTTVIMPTDCDLI